jgi:cytidine deaminase
MPSLKQLEQQARLARENAYAPYSNFQVGAALEVSEGRVFTGCNVENLSFGLTICAERSAVATAIAQGARNFKRIVVVADSDEPVTPCGACRQVLAEFNEEMEVVSMNLKGKKFRASLSALLPRPKAGILDQPSST